MKYALGLSSILALGLHTSQAAALPVESGAQICHFEERDVLARTASSRVKRQETWDPPADLVTPLQEASSHPRHRKKYILANRCLAN
jgi:hypothetical protein